MSLSYAHGIADKPLVGKKIGDLLDEIADQFPENDALVSVFEKRRFAYAAFRRETDRCARALLALGVNKGDRIGIWATNCVPWVLLQFATAKIGAILVSINPAYRLYELEFALRQSECNVLISGERFKDADYAQMLHAVIPELSAADPRRDFHSDRLPHLRRLAFLSSQRQPGLMPWSELLSGADQISSLALAERQASLDFDEVINIQYTSGTTGFPKGAML